MSKISLKVDDSLDSVEESIYSLDRSLIFFEDCLINNFMNERKTGFP